MSRGALGSWGQYPNKPQQAHRCAWLEDIAVTLQTVSKNHKSTLAYGNGRSYGDSCLAVSNQVLHTRALDRFIAVDWVNGIVCAEAGATLETILTYSIPKGWFLPVTPGTKYVTLGGAVANDVHGKNHHVKGTFGRFVRRFGLLRSDREEIACSEKENQDLYKATIAGLGLTGIITWVEIQLAPIQSSDIAVTNIRFNNLGEFFDLSNELDSQHEYTVAWIDCLAKGKHLGRGIYSAGDFAENGSLEVGEKRKRSIPLTPPVSFVNQTSLSLFNKIYYNRCEPGRKKTSIGYDPFFYPLDSLLYWNRIYGKKGFQQYQCVVPEDSAQDIVKEMLGKIAEEQTGSFLAVLKRCGDIASPGILSFPMPGISLALDFPQSKKLENLFNELDVLLVEAGGRIYPAKDAHMSAAHFQKFYPNWKALEKMRDPALCSQFWKRVALS